MKHVMTSLCAALLLASPLLAKDDDIKPDTDGAKPGVWTMDFDAAKKIAAEKDLPLLLNFTGSDWCGWCKLMVKQVFSKSDWTRYAKKNVMLVWIDFPNDDSLVPKKYVERNAELQKTYGVGGYPTFIVLNSDGTTRLGNLGASRDASPDNFIDKLKALTDKREKKAASADDKKVETPPVQVTLPLTEAQLARLPEAKREAWLEAKNAYDTAAQKLKDAKVQKLPESPETTAAMKALETAVNTARDNLDKLTKEATANP